MNAEEKKRTLHAEFREKYLQDVDDEGELREGRDAASWFAGGCIFEGFEEAQQVVGVLRVERHPSYSEDIRLESADECVLADASWQSVPKTQEVESLPEIGFVSGDAIGLQENAEQRRLPRSQLDQLVADDVGQVGACGLLGSTLPDTVPIDGRVRSIEEERLIDKFRKYCVKPFTIRKGPKRGGDRNVKKKFKAMSNESVWKCLTLVPNAIELRVMTPKWRQKVFRRPLCHKLLLSILFDDILVHQDVKTHKKNDAIGWRSGSCNWMATCVRWQCMIILLSSQRGFGTNWQGSSQDP